MLASGALILPAPPVANAAETQACVDGFSRVAPTGLIMPEAAYGGSGTRLFTAGGVHLSGGRRAARVATYSKVGWRTASTLKLGSDAGYVALGGTPFSGLWAVGYVQTRTSLRPLAARRRANRSWRQVTTPRPSGAGATLVDVAAHQRSSAWAVGYRLGKPGVQLPYALRWGGGKWTTSNPALRTGERGALSAVSTSKDGGTWIAGSTSRYGATRPFVAKRTNGRWVRKPVPPVEDGALAAIQIESPDDGWAAGHHIEGNAIKPLLLRWNGTAWKRAAAPELDGDTLLFDVSSDRSGTITVVGSTWDSHDTRMKGFSATNHGDGWSIEVYEATPRHSVFTAVDGNPSSGGWLAGRDLKSGVVAQTCPPVTAAAAGPARQVRDARRLATRMARGGIAEADLHQAEAAPAPRGDLDRVPKLQIAAAGNVTIRDRARATGLPTVATTHGAVIKDFERTAETTSSSTATAVRQRCTSIAGLRSSAPPRASDGATAMVAPRWTWTPAGYRTCTAASAAVAAWA